jgi:hypothetical protein
MIILRSIKRSIYVKVKITGSFIVINIKREKFLVKNLVKRANHIIE